MNWAFKFFSLSGFSSENLDAQNSPDLAPQMNKTLEEHIIQENLTPEQLAKISKHYKSKNVSELPEWFKKKIVPREHAGILLYTIIWQEMENGETLGKESFTVDSLFYAKFCYDFI